MSENDWDKLDYEEYIKEKEEFEKEAKKRKKKEKKKIIPFTLGFDMIYRGNCVEKLFNGCEVTTSMDEIPDRGLMGKHLKLRGEVIKGKLVFDIRGATIPLKKLAKSFGLKLKWKV